MPEKTDGETNGVLTEKEKNIIDAAVRLFSLYGYTGTTTLAIAQEARVSEKTLFNYFHTKQDLYDRSVYPLLKTMIIQKTEVDKEKDDSEIYGLLYELFTSKIHLANENPDSLKLIIHEFLMNSNFQKQMAESWNTSYLPQLVSRLHLSKEVGQKYGSQLSDALSRIVVSTLFAYAIDKIYIRPQRKFDDETEIKLMLQLLIQGMNGLDKNYLGDNT